MYATRFWVFSSEYTLYMHEYYSVFVEQQSILHFLGNARRRAECKLQHSTGQCRTKNDTIKSNVITDADSEKSFCRDGALLLMTAGACVSFVCLVSLTFLGVSEAAAAAVDGGASIDGYGGNRLDLGDGTSEGTNTGAPFTTNNVASDHQQRQRDIGIDDGGHGPQAHVYVTPTLLSTTAEHDDGTGTRLANSLLNPLYRELEECLPSTIQRWVVAGNDDPLTPSAAVDGPAAPRIAVDRHAVKFHEPLTVSWSWSGGATPHGDGVVAFYCPAGEPDPRKFRDAVRIDGLRHKRTEGRGGMSDIEMDVTARDLVGGHQGNSTGDYEWHIESFPIVREGTCEFRLLTRSRKRRRPCGGDATVARGGVRDNNASCGGGERSSRSHARYAMAARTGPVLVTGASETPTAVHLALTGCPTEMRVHFTTGKVAGATPVVSYYPDPAETGVSSSLGADRRHSIRRKEAATAAMVVEGTSRTYLASDMCAGPANETAPGMFIDPGMLHVVTMTNLTPGAITYQYRVGLRSGGVDSDNADGAGEILAWSSEFTFQSPLGDNTGSSDVNTQPFSFVVYGDQGSPKRGWAEGRDRMERFVKRELDDSGGMLRAVHHLGDLSYAMGAGHVWDAWFNMIEPLASRVPLMIAVGNHEYDHVTGGSDGRDPSGVVTPGGFEPPWGDLGGNDSGGECGIPTSARFDMPSDVDDAGNNGNNGNNGNGVFWYSYDYASAHVVVISSEHDLSPTSRQYAWLEHDLARVDRSRTPWLLVESHRPMYESQLVGRGHGGVGNGMRREFESLLRTHRVDLFFSGHYHAYLRSCPGLYDGLCDQGGPMHVTVGTGGAHLLFAPLRRLDWVEAFLVEWGYGRVTVANASALLFEFVADDGGEVKDDIWLYK